MRSTCTALRPVVKEWLTILPLDSLDYYDLEPVIRSFYHNDRAAEGVAHLHMQFERCRKTNQKFAPEQLFSVLEGWASEMPEELVAQLATHCREMIDWMLSNSVQARVRRSSQLIWQAWLDEAHASSSAPVAGVPFTMIFDRLRLAGDFAEPELRSTFWQYLSGSNERAASGDCQTVDLKAFCRLLDQLYGAHAQPHRIDALLASGSASALGTTIGAAGSPLKEALGDNTSVTSDESNISTLSPELAISRRKRLAQVVRHCFDGLLPASAVGALARIPSKDAAWHRLPSLAWCIQYILHTRNDEGGEVPPSVASKTFRSVPFADASVAVTIEQTELDAAWQWLLTATTTELDTRTLLRYMRSCTLWNPTADGALHAVAALVLHPLLDPACLMVKSECASVLSRWCTSVVQLACHYRKWSWPPPQVQGDASVSPKRAPPAAARAAEDDELNITEISATEDENDNTLLVPDATPRSEVLPLFERSKSSTQRHVRVPYVFKYRSMCHDLSTTDSPMFDRFSPKRAMERPSTAPSNRRAPKQSRRPDSASWSRQTQTNPPSAFGPSTTTVAHNPLLSATSPDAPAAATRTHVSPPPTTTCETSQSDARRTNTSQTVILPPTHTGEFVMCEPSRPAEALGEVQDNADDAVAAEETTAIRNAECEGSAVRHADGDADTEELIGVCPPAAVEEFVMCEPSRPAEALGAVQGNADDVVADDETAAIRVGSPLEVGVFVMSEHPERAAECADGDADTEELIGVCPPAAVEEFVKCEPSRPAEALGEVQGNADDVVADDETAAIRVGSPLEVGVFVMSEHPERAAECEGSADGRADGDADTEELIGVCPPAAVEEFVMCERSCAPQEETVFIDTCPAGVEAWKVTDTICVEPSPVALQPFVASERVCDGVDGNHHEQSAEVRVHPAACMEQSCETIETASPAAVTEFVMNEARRVLAEAAECTVGQEMVSTSETAAVVVAVAEAFVPFIANECVSSHHEATCNDGCSVGGHTHRDSVEGAVS